MIEPPGHAKLQLVEGVTPLHPEEATLDAMVDGWLKQQIGGRGSTAKYAEVNTRIIRKFVTYTNTYPWQWTASDMDEWTYHLYSEKKLSQSSVRNYQGAVRLFCSFITDPAYGWAEYCIAQFGDHPIQICHEWNTRVHNNEHEGSSARRPFTRNELQKLMDYADDQVEVMIKNRRKGALTAYRDSTAFKVIFGWGLRVSEAINLDTADIARNPKAPQFHNAGSIHVRRGKGSKGSGPRRRTVVSIVPWAVEALTDYMENVRPLFPINETNALFPTERGTRLKVRELQDRLATYRNALGFDESLTLHSLRHSYVSHHIEDGVDAEFIRMQVGHAYRSTTGIYTTVSTEYMNTMMEHAVKRVVNGDGTIEQ